MTIIQADKILGDVLMHDHISADISDLTATLDPRYLKITSNLSDLNNVVTARTNLGLIAGGAGDIWVEKAGDTMTPVANSTTTFNITNSAGTSVLDVDTTNRRVGFGTDTPLSRVHIAGGTANDYLRVDSGINLDQVDNPNTTGFSATVLNVAGNINAGVHYYAYTLVTSIGETRITNPVGPYSFDASNAQATITIPVSTDYRVTGRKIYRTTAGSSQYNLFLVGTINDNTTTTWTDNVADSGLGTVYSWYRPNTTSAGILVNGVKTQLTDAMMTLYGYNAGTGAAAGGGYFNTLIGSQAGSAVTSGYNNTAVGSSAGQNLTVEANNVIMGEYAGYNIKSSNNIAIGVNALWGINGAVTGSYNTIIGGSAAYNLKGSVSNNTFLGYGSGNGANTGTVSGNIFIGINAGKTAAQNNAVNLLHIHNNDSLTPMIYGLFSGAGAGVTIHSQNTGGVPLIVKGIASQSSDLQQWQNSSGTVLGCVTGAGNVGIGTTAPAGRLHINGTADDEQLIVEGHSTQTANLTEWRNSSGSVLSRIGSNGEIVYNSSTLPNGEKMRIVGSYNDTSALTDAVFLNGSYTPTNATGDQQFNALYVQANANATSQAITGSVFGSYYQVYTGGANNISRVVAFNALGEHYGSGTLSELTAFNSSLILRSGGGNITYAYGMSLGLTLQQAGKTVGTYIGVNISTPTITAGTLTNAYGIYLNSINTAGTTNYAILTNAGNIVFNEGGDASTDFRVEGDTDANLLFSDASADKIGIGKNNPAYKLDVTGEINATTGYRVNGTAGATGTFTTADAKTVTVTNGIITAIV